MYFVVPFSMELVGPYVQFVELRSCYFAAFLIGALVQPCVYLQPFAGARRADQLDDDFQSFQGNSLPIAGDVAEQAVLDLVPFARARWEMAHFDDHARFVRKPLEHQLPEPIARAVAATAVGRDDQWLR